MNIRTKIGSITAATLLAVMPLAASANTLSASGSTGITISPSGIVRVIGADVTAVGTNVIDAVLNLGNAVINVVLNTSGNTQVVANGSKTATTSDIAVGDSVAFKGTLSSSSSSTLTVAASKVRDMTNFPFPHIAAGTLTSVNLTNGSFTVSGKDNTSTTVLTNASTSITLNGTTTALAALPVNSKVVVIGTQNTDGTITATKVLVNSHAAIGKDNRQHDNDTDKNDNDNDGDNGNHGTGNATSTANRHDGKGFGLNLFRGLHLGEDN